MVLLKVSYRVRAHHIREFERVFSDQILPLIQEHQLRLQGIWKTLLGDVGEYLELWEFESVSEFDVRWTRLMKDPRMEAIFQVTGPMVEAENFSLLEPALSESTTTPRSERLA